MNDRVDALQSVIDSQAVAHVADDQLHLTRQIAGRPAACVNLPGQVVQRPYAIAALKQSTAQMRADKPSSSRDQDVLAQANSLRRGA